MKEASILKKISLLNIQNKRQEAIKISRDFLKKNKNNEEILVWLSFLLYHKAAEILYKKKKTKEEERQVKIMFNKSISTLKKIIKKTTNNKILTNSKIYLAQIYAILGDKRSIKIAKENYRMQKSAIMANRLADIYDRMEQNKKAHWWYKKVEKMAFTNEEKIMANQGLTNFYKKIGESKLADGYQKKTLSLIEKIKNKSVKKSMKKILKK